MSGRTKAAETPLALRTSGIGLTPELREHVLGRMGWRLGKFALHIERLTVRFEDVNGPRGGVDTVCRIKVVLSGLPSISIEDKASGAFEAFNRADDRVERAVRRAIGRAQTRGRLRGVRAARAVTKVRPVARKSARTSTATRNVKSRTRKASAALEGSLQARPSRKSTRGTVNGLRQGNKLARRQARRVSSPKARKAQARKKR